MFFPDEELNRDQTKNIVLKRWFNGNLNSKNKYRAYMLKRLPRISEIINCLKFNQYDNFSNSIFAHSAAYVVFNAPQEKIEDNSLLLVGSHYDKVVRELAELAVNYEEQIKGE